MLIAGFQKTSFVDYPGKISAVVFTPGCNMRCWYCHNSHINAGEVELIEEGEIFAYLRRRSDMLDGLVISGGEPTLQKDLRGFIVQARELGYAIKLDTNGTNPRVLSGLMSDGLLDYVAMDIKAPLDRYGSITCTEDDMSAVRRSINLLINGGVDYEFRTTFAPGLLPEDMDALAADIAGAKRYFIQQYRKISADAPEPHAPSEVERAAHIARERLGNCTVRGL